VGAGIEGSATAYFLAKSGHRTLLLEQFPLGHARGSSHGGSRLTRKSYDKALYTRMMLEGDGLWSELERESGKTLCKKVGLLLVAPESKKVIPGYKAVTDSYNLPSTVFKGAKLREKYPQLRNAPQNWEALFEPEAGLLFADKCLDAFHTQFQRYGGTIKENEKVIKIRPMTDSVQILTDTYGQYTCRSIVLCLGSWSGKFLKSQLNLTLPLQVVAITVCYWKERTPGVYSADNGFPPVWILADDGQEYFMFPSAEYPGYVKAAYNHGPTIDPDTKEGLLLEESVQKMSKFIGQYFPDAESSQPTSAQQCLYTFTPDNHVILDRHPSYPNVIIGAGFSGHGFKLAPVVGRILGTLATRKPGHENLDYDLAEVGIRRFTDKKQDKASGIRHMM